MSSASKRWAATWQNQQNGCTPSEDSDQPGHPPSLIRVFAVRMKKAWVLSYPLSTQWRLWSDWAEAQADLSLCWAHTHFVGFFMSRLICRWTGRQTSAPGAVWSGSTLFANTFLSFRIITVLLLISKTAVIKVKYLFSFGDISFNCPFFSAAIFILINASFPINIWATTWQNQQSECAPSEDSDQPGHPPSLICLRCALSG